MAHWVKLPPTTQAIHSSAPLATQLPANVPEKAVGNETSPWAPSSM